MPKLFKLSKKEKTQYLRHRGIDVHPKLAEDLLEALIENDKTEVELRDWSRGLTK